MDTLKSKTLFLIAAILLAPAVLAQSNKAQVKTVAENFVKSADKHDHELLASVLHEDAKQFVKFGPQVMQSSASEYVEQIKSKKLGGVDRSIEFQSVELEGEDVAYVKLQAIREGLNFSYQLTLFKLEDSWKIMTITTKVART